jgi:hypothetical protein
MMSGLSSFSASTGSSALPATGSSSSQPDPIFYIEGSVPIDASDIDSLLEGSVSVTTQAQRELNNAQARFKRGAVAYEKTILELTNSSRYRTKASIVQAAKVLKDKIAIDIKEGIRLKLDDHVRGSKRSAPNPEPRTPNPEPRTPNPEPR